MSAVVTVQDLHKHFGNRRVLDGVSFAVHERDRIGLIGANGAGKSTLLKMMVHGAGGDDDPALEPDGGMITWRRDLSLEYVAQEPRLALGEPISAVLVRPGVPDHEIQTVAAALQLPPLEKLVGELSIGERRRVALAHALPGKPEVLALDEPTKHLDARTNEWLETPVAAIERWVKGLLFDCRMCGQCALGATGMSCPMNCPKNLRNGPCGGVRASGPCEVDPRMTCGWVDAVARTATRSAKASSSSPGSPSSAERRASTCARSV